MANNDKKKARAAKSGTGAKRARILSQVPVQAIFVNQTELTNRVLKAACAMGTPSTLRILYFGTGLLMAIAAVIGRAFFGVNTLVFCCVLLLALMIIWQGNRLPLENALRLSRELEKASNKSGTDARDRVCFATALEFGCLMPDGSIKTWKWSEFETFFVNTDLIVIMLKETKTTFALSVKGFIKGKPGDFVSFLNTHINVKQRNAFERVCDKICYTLDNWTQLSKADKEAKEAEKAAKKAAKKSKGAK